MKYPDHMSHAEVRRSGDNVSKLWARFEASPTTSNEDEAHAAEEEHLALLANRRSHRSTRRDLSRANPKDPEKAAEKFNQFVRSDDKLVTL
jgi:hypothetical protein